VEWTLNSVIDHTAAAQVGPEVLAVGVEHVDRAFVIPEGDEFGAEVAERDDGTLGDVGAPSNLEPSGRLHAGHARHDHSLTSRAISTITSQQYWEWRSQTTAC
jgi:hypothetical protein